MVSFLRGTDDEHYGADVFRPQWQFVERCLQEGKIIAPRQIEAELEKWQKSICLEDAAQGRAGMRGLVRSMQEATAVGVSGTPAWLVGDGLLVGLRSVAEFTALAQILATRR